MMMSTTNLPEGFLFMEEVSRYMKKKFLAAIRNRGQWVEYPENWPFTFLIDCDLAVEIIVQAYHNKGKILKLIGICISQRLQSECGLGYRAIYILYITEKYGPKYGRRRRNIGRLPTI